MEGIQVTLRLITNSSAAVLGDDGDEAIAGDGTCDSPGTDTLGQETCELSPSSDYQYDACVVPCLSNEELSSMLEVDLLLAENDQFHL